MSTHRQQRNERQSFTEEPYRVRTFAVNNEVAAYSILETENEVALCRNLCKLQRHKAASRSIPQELSWHSCSPTLLSVALSLSLAYDHGSCSPGLMQLVVAKGCSGFTLCNEASPFIEQLSHGALILVLPCIQPCIQPKWDVKRRLRKQMKIKSKGGKYPLYSNLPASRLAVQSNIPYQNYLTTNSSTKLPANSSHNFIDI